MGSSPVRVTKVYRKSLCGRVISQSTPGFLPLFKREAELLPSTPHQKSSFFIFVFTAVPVSALLCAGPMLICPSPTKSASILLRQNMALMPYKLILHPYPLPLFMVII